MAFSLLFYIVMKTAKYLLWKACAVIVPTLVAVSALASGYPSVSPALPLDTHDSAIFTVSPQELDEAKDDQSTRPIVGLKYRADLTDQIEQNIIDQQSYEMYRNHYRKVIEDAITHRHGG